MNKREGYLSWEEYFMALALLSAERSKDPSTQVGACIVDKNNKVVSLGYNGAPIGFHDDNLPWDKREGKFEETKYPYVCHAEANAIYNAAAQGVVLRDTKVFVNLFPCEECAKAIIQSGIKEIIYLEDKYAETPGVKFSKNLFNSCGVSYRQLEVEKEIVINLGKRKR